MDATVHDEVATIAQALRAYAHEKEVHEASTALQSKLMGQVQGASQLSALQRQAVEEALLRVRAKLDAYDSEEADRQATIGKLAERISHLRAQIAR